MPGKAAKVVVTEKQLSILNAVVASRTAPVRLVERARIIVLAFGKKRNDEIAQEVPLNPQQIGQWRRRWQQAFTRLVAIECRDGVPALRKVIEEEVLADLPGRGRKPVFSDEQRAQIQAIACEVPEDASERPISQWTHRELADEAVKREIVTTISPRTVGDFLKRTRSEATPRKVLAES